MMSVQRQNQTRACLSARRESGAAVTSDINLPTPPKPDPQDHMGITGVLTDMATRLHTAEALCPIAIAQRKAGNETKGWDRLPPTDQRVILTESATNGTSILTLPPPTIHRFLNARNVTALQADCYLTYARDNIYLPTSLCQALLQGHILEIPYLDAPTVLSPLLTLPSSAGPENTQNRSIIIQVLLSMGHYLLSKEEAGEILEQRFHVLASTQELRRLTRNFVKLVGYYLEEESPICLSIGMCPHHIDRFEPQCDKVFAKDPLFGEDLIDRIHRRIQVFLHSYNTTDIEDVELGALVEFRGLQKKVERG